MKYICVDAFLGFLVTYTSQDNPAKLNFFKNYFF